MCVAAHGFAAVAIIRKHFRFVPRTDLTHLDSRLVFAGKFLDQFAKINAIIGGKVNDDLFAAKDLFDIDECHRQIEFADQFSAESEIRFDRLLEMEVFVFIGGRSVPLNGPVRWLLHLFDDTVGRFAEYFTPFETSIGACDHDTSARVLAFRVHHEQSSHSSASDNVSWHIVGQTGKKEETSSWKL